MAESKITPIVEEIKNPPLPEDLIRSLKHRPYSFFLDSSCDREKLGRFSFLGCDPFLVFSSKRDSVRLEWRDGKKEIFKANPLLALKGIFKKYANTGSDPSGLPLLSGGVGYLAYDLKGFVEALPDAAPDDIRLPDCIMGFYDTIVIYDNLCGRCCISSCGLPEAGREKRGKRARGRLAEFKAILSGTSPAKTFPGPFSAAGLDSNFSKHAYLDTIRKAKDYIKKGDIYQVNLSQRFRTSISTEPLELYRRLRTVNPAPFSAYLDFGGAVILSSSPERFLLKRGSYIETRPIKGTRPRGRDMSEDLAMEKELISSRKDRAEHIMIVDLERNDLGRVCDYGSVRPAEFVILEKYSTVFHLVSTVAGNLRKGVDAVDCLLAAFPGGSITGAPKIRAMQIIEELEPVKRAIYTGSIGYIDFRGNMDTSIVIRTFLIKDKDVYFQVGGGIVADSDPEDEYKETLDKAEGLLRALGAKSGNREYSFA